MKGKASGRAEVVEGDLEKRDITERDLLSGRECLCRREEPETNELLGEDKKAAETKRELSASDPPKTRAGVQGPKHGSPKREKALAYEKKKELGEGGGSRREKKHF